LLGARSLPLRYNAVAESFFPTLKTQPIYHRKLQDQGKTEQALFNYIEIYYNRRRRHSTIGYQSPAMFESNWVKIENAA
jgi:putative transposase